ncbi:putative manganese-dependent inorganic diphosphatase [Hippea maritima]|uniref:CBS domain containing protein n=1 Tax=Hippea maritima (strain ATCC 700847 / DSM 10411 / MH2) TaxID=760142 RepID=F2LVM6_HIPMA|nr:putative manganese-dependent inorganic diphosphatase [Hippea maritima]AEA33810.1 CBS domain containing protein [Hippea maritima DSM 10411]
MREIKNIYVVGRKNPDLDSVACSITYAELKNTIDKETNYVPAVCGRIDVATQKLFGHFNIPFPKYIADLSLRVEDVMTSQTITVNKNDPVTEIFKLMLKNDLMVVPVVDDSGKFIGYLGMIDIARKSISSVMPDIFRKIKTSISIIKKAVNGEVIVKIDEDETKQFVATTIMGVMDVDCLFEIIDRIDPENTIIVIGNRKDLQKAAIELGVKCVILSYGCNLDNELASLAKQKGVFVIRSEYDAFATVGLIEWGTPVESVCEKSSVFVNLSDLVNEIKEKVYQSSNRAVAVVDKSNKVRGIITRTDIIKYNKRNVILVDHSSSANAPDGIFECNVLEIIDHHRIGDIQTGYRTRYRIEPWGSTAAIIADEFAKHKVKPSKTTAMLLASAIIVNTEFLKEEKATDYDIEALQWVCSLWDIDIEEFSEEIKSVLNS